MPAFHRNGLCVLTCAALACVVPARADLSVLETGAVADGKTDCTAAFQQALDKVAAAGGGIVNVPAGQFRINGAIKIPGLVTLQGIARTAPLDTRDAQGRYKRFGPDGLRRTGQARDSATH